MNGEEFDDDVSTIQWTAFALWERFSKLKGQLYNIGLMVSVLDFFGFV